MKKAPIIVILILALFFTATPFLVGMKIQSDIENIVAEINASNTYSIEIKQYDRGWLSSSGEFSVDLNFPDLSDDSLLGVIGKQVQLGFDFDLNHGPFIKGSGLGLLSWDYRLQNADKLRAYAHWEKDIPLYKSSGAVSLGGNVRFQESIPIISSTETLEEEITFAIGGYVGYGKVIDGLMVYSGSTGSLEVSSDRIQADISPVELDLEMDFDLEKIFNGGLYNNRAKFEIDSIDINGDEPASFDELKIKVDMRLTDDPELADIGFHYSVDSINTEPVAMKDFILNLDFENYSAAFHRAYMDFSKDIDLTQSPEQHQVKNQEFLAQSLPLLLKASPTFKVNELAFNLLGKGEFDANMEVRLDSIDALTSDPMDMLFWADKAYANASLSIDQGVIDYLAYLRLSEDIIARAPEGQNPTTEDIHAAVDAQVQFGISMLSGMGMITPTDKGYEVKAEYDHGATKVNGEDFALPF